MSLCQNALWRALQYFPDLVIEVLGHAAQATLQLSALQRGEPIEEYIKFI